MDNLRNAMQMAVERAAQEVLKAIEDGDMEIHEILHFLKDNSQYVMPKMTATMQKIESSQSTQKIEGISEDEQKYLDSLK